MGFEEIDYSQTEKTRSESYRQWDRLMALLMTVQELIHEPDFTKTILPTISFLIFPRHQSPVQMFLRINYIFRNYPWSLGWLAGCYARMPAECSMWALFAWIGSSRMNLAQKWGKLDDPKLFVACWKIIKIAGIYCLLFIICNGWLWLHGLRLWPYLWCWVTEAGETGKK